MDMHTTTRAYTVMVSFDDDDDDEDVTTHGDKSPDPGEENYTDPGVGEGNSVENEIL